MAVHQTTKKGSQSMAMPEDDAVDKEHDKGYKDVLANKGDFVHFLTKYFPGPWTANITPDVLERVDMSYISEEYKYIDADLIYKLKSKTGGADVYFYVLIELQSTVDHTVSFRHFQYISARLGDDFNNTPKEVRECKDFRLPAVVPITLYNGKDNWTTIRSFRMIAYGDDVNRIVKITGLDQNDVLKLMGTIQ